MGHFVKMFEDFEGDKETVCHTSSYKVEKAAVGLLAGEVTVSRQHIHTTYQKDLCYQYFYFCQVNKANFSPK